MDYYMRLTLRQFRAVGTNYNQVVKILYRNFSGKESRSLSLINWKNRQNMVLSQKIILPTQEFEAKYLKK
jgi:hypothetical protein